MTAKLTIIDAIKDEKLFRSFLADADDSLSSWSSWLAVLRVLYGLPLPKKAKRRAVLGEVTQRKCEGFPADGFDTALLLTGRRSGKSRIAAVIGAYESVLAGHESKLAKGEKGLVAICSPTKKQSRIVKNYIRAIFEAPLLRNEVVGETKEGFELANGILIELMAGDFRSVRGYTLLAVIVDEAAFFGVEEEAKIKSDTELIRALKPALATTGGKLIAITSPYARKGWTFTTHQKHFGKEDAKTLVVNCPSRTLNPTLPQRIIDEALAEDYAAAKSEYLGEFREDVGIWLPREVIERLVIPNRFELLPRTDISYAAFCDVSGGRGDDAALAIAHRVDRTVVLDFVKRYRPPFNPYVCIGDMAEICKRYRVRKVIGDNYAANFVEMAFKEQGLRYEKSDIPASGLYLETLPRFCASEVELLDDPKKLIVQQFASLERRTRSGGKDTITHPTNGHDDVANAVAGAVVFAFKKQIRIGAF